jgi:hypothetical protein
VPGEVRHSQNWIGGSRPGNALYVPPPPHALGELLTAFEKYMHANDRSRVLSQEGTSVVSLRLFELLPRHPIVTVASAMKLVDTR